MIHYSCDGCGTQDLPVETIGEDRHYCAECMPAVDAFLRDIHEWLRQRAIEYRKLVQEHDDQLRVLLPKLSRLPRLDEIRIVIEDREA